MDALIAGFEGWVRDHAAWAPLLGFLLAFLESLPGISLLVPATALLLGLGVLVGQDILAPWPLIASVVGGGILGDAVGYWVCRWYGRGMVQRWMPRTQRRNYARAVLLFRRWGWAAVFFGRFVGPVRAFAPAIAGVSGMRHRHFQLANCTSAVIWAPLMILPGVVLGHLGNWLRMVGESPPLIGATAAVLAALTVAGWWWYRAGRARLVQGVRNRPAQPGPGPAARRNPS